MSEAAYWWVNQVQVQTFLGRGTFGDQWAASQTVDCWVEAGSKLVRDASGTEVVSTAAVHGPLSDAGKFTVGTKVATPGAAAARVLTLDRFDSGTLNLQLDHFVAHLT
jgi:hypothetical protein